MGDFDKLTLDEKRDYINNILHAGEAVVEFTKVNGEHRVMPCSLNAALLPPAPPVVEGKVERKINPDVIRVFCIDKQEWRSFRIDRVISIIPK